MSAEKRVTFDEHGQPKVTVTLEGWSDVLRFSWAIQHLQCEFVALGHAIDASLRRRLGAKRWKELDDHYTGRKPLR